MNDDRTEKLPLPGFQRNGLSETAATGNAAIDCKAFRDLLPVGETVSTWEVGSTSAYRFRLFGLIPYGTHTIHILRFDPDGVSSREKNAHVPVWNHEISLVEKDESHTLYTDRVEIRAGWETAFIWLWANAFYAHRQRKWVRLLNGSKR